MREVHRPAMAAIITRFFDEQEAKLLPEIKMIDFSSFFDFSFWKQRFIDLLIGNIRKVLEDGMLAGMLRAGLGEITEEQLEARNVQLDIIARQVARSELVNKNTENDITEMLVQMVQENATQNEMQAALRQKFDGYRSYRVDRIVNTVVVGAFESGTLLSWQEAGITNKGWLATQDGRVRQTHGAANGQEVDINSPFTVGTAELAHPGDPNGPVGEIVNCRCTMIPIIED